MVSSSRVGSPSSTPQDQDKGAERESENRTEANLSLSASVVPEESVESTTEKVQDQCLQLSDSQDGTQDTSAGLPERPQSSPLNDNDINGSLCDYSEEEMVDTVENPSSAPLESFITSLSTQQPLQPVVQSLVSEIDEEGNIIASEADSSAPILVSPVKTRRGGGQEVSGRHQEGSEGCSSA